jgi:hypothetical protein
MGSKEAAVSPDSILLFLYYFAFYCYFPFDFGVVSYIGQLPMGCFLTSRVVSYFDQNLSNLTLISESEVTVSD